MRGLKYISWGDTTGYATAAKSYVAALADAGVNISWSPMVPGPRLYEPTLGKASPVPSLQNIYHRDIEYDRVIIHTVPEYYPEWLERERKPGRRIYGYTVWELERLPRHWPDILNQLDGVIVPCQWNVSVFRDSGVHVPIHVVPHLSQFESMPEPSPTDRDRLLGHLGDYRQSIDNRFVFYTIGFWSHRKAPYLAIEAYWKAFAHDDPVLMVVKTSNKDITCWHRSWRNGFRLRHPSPALSIERMIRKSGGKLAPVALIADEQLSDGEMQSLHALGDCFVSLTRTEGWGLGAFEGLYAVSCGT